jgi:hypothetical protein
MILCKECVWVEIPTCSFIGNHYCPESKLTFSQTIFATQKQAAYSYYCIILTLLLSIGNTTTIFIVHLEGDAIYTCKCFHLTDHTGDACSNNLPDLPFALMACNIFIDLGIVKSDISPSSVFWSLYSLLRVFLPKTSLVG